MSDTDKTDNKPPFFEFDTSSIDRLLAHIEGEATTPQRRNAILDELLRISTGRHGLVRMFVVTRRDNGAEGCTFKLRPSREFVERIDDQLARLKRDQAT